jgi:phospholipid-translocating ATPase
VPWCPLQQTNFSFCLCSVQKKGASFNVLSIFEQKRPPPLPRTVLVDMPLPIEAWAPSRKGKKQLKQGIPADQIDRKVDKKPALGWEYESNQVR